MWDELCQPGRRKSQLPSRALTPVNEVAEAGMRRREIRHIASNHGKAVLQRRCRNHEVRALVAQGRA